MIKRLVHCLRAAQLVKYQRSPRERLQYGWQFVVELTHLQNGEFCATIERCHKFKVQPV